MERESDTDVVRTQSHEYMEVKTCFVVCSVQRTGVRKWTADRRGRLAKAAKPDWRWTKLKDQPSSSASTAEFTSWRPISTSRIRCCWAQPATTYLQTNSSITSIWTVSLHHHMDYFSLFDCSCFCAIRSQLFAWLGWGNREFSFR